MATSSNVGFVDFTSQSGLPGAHEDQFRPISPFSCPYRRNRRSYTGIAEGYGWPFVGRTPGLRPAAWPALGPQAGDGVCRTPGSLPRPTKPALPVELYKAPVGNDRGFLTSGHSNSGCRTQAEPNVSNFLALTLAARVHGSHMDFLGCLES